ncbi:DNA polymerase III subunit beta [Paenibacillus agri]|uniref:Beta sliding clamp n=1 Tax=Paenibacillus agri TaxID=2744309 RepID=A0A850ER38_9BACL|nr:DNA polymerase III subunit beta [Paenibacillus agri]NUU62966.1 DNA polymerase III subunit beta [Paenibacillus agri]
MRVSVTKESLLHALQHVLKAVSVNHLIPILSGVSIRKDQDALIFTTSNTNMTIEYRISLTTSSTPEQEDGAIVVPARYLYELVRKLEPGSIRLETTEQWILLLSSGDAHIRLCGMDSTEFPTIQKTDRHKVASFSINNAVLKSAVRQVASAVSTSETRPILTGVFFEWKNEVLRLIATDGVRLALRTLTVEQSAAIHVQGVIPGVNLYEVSKMLKDEQGTTVIEVGTNQIQFTSKELQVQSALLEGAYPSVEKLIPQSFSSELTVKTVSLLQAVERVSVLASGSIIRLVVSGGSLELLSQTAEIGDVLDQVALLEKNGEDFRISLNATFLLDILRCIDCEDVRFRFTGIMGPLVILPQDLSASMLFLITPVRTAN